MRRLQNARSGFQAAGMAVTAAGLEIEKAHLPTSFVFQAVLILAALAIVIVLLGRLFRILVDRFWTVRRVIVGRRDIEGCWTDFTIDEAGNLINVAFATITYRNGYYCFDGVAWYTDSTRRVHWETLQSDYSRHTLTYRYDTWKSGDPRSTEHGAGFLGFEKEHRIAKYTGEFIDVYHLLRCRTYGERVPQAWFRPPKLTYREKRDLAEAHKERSLAEVRLELGLAS
jgi:hypothetical protein